MRMIALRTTTPERLINPRNATHVARLFRKDLGLAVEAAEAAGLRLETLRQTAERTIADVEASAE